MWETVVKLGLSEGPLAEGPGSCMGWLFGACYLLWDAMLSFDAVGKILDLCYLNVPGFVDSLRKPFPIGRSGWKVGWR